MENAPQASLSRAEVYHGTLADCPFSILFGSSLSKTWTYAISADKAREGLLSGRARYRASIADQRRHTCLRVSGLRIVSARLGASVRAGQSEGQSLA